MTLMQQALIGNPVPVGKRPSRFLSWRGGKRWVADQIWQITPSPVCRDLVEPFAGMASVSAWWRHCGAAERVHLGDADWRVAQWWQAAAADPQKLGTAIAKLADAHTPELWHWAREQDDLCSQAHLWGYLNLMCVMYGGSMPLDASAAPAQIPHARRVAAGLAESLAALAIENAHHGRYHTMPLPDPDGSLIYLDPPYVDTANYPGLPWHADDALTLAQWAADRHADGYRVIATELAGSALMSRLEALGWQTHPLTIKRTVGHKHGKQRTNEIVAVSPVS